MRKTFFSAVLVGTAVIGLAACGADDTASTDDGGDAAADTNDAADAVTDAATDAIGDAADAVAHAAGCQCEAGKAGDDIWCADCSKGFVGGEAVTKCESCFLAKTGGPACEACANKEN